MSTNTSSASTATSWPPLLSQDQVAKLNVAFDFVIIPCLTAMGICGNVLSMFLLARQGFRKSSNVLLFGLALADVFFLTGINNFSRHVQVGNVPVGFTFTETINYMFYIFYMLQIGAHFIGLNCSILIPVLITADRLLVVFLPLKVHTIVTPLRTLLALSCVGALVIGCFIYQYVLCYGFEQVILVNGARLGRIVPTERLYTDLRNGTLWIFMDIVSYMTGIIPMALVSLGCSIIGLKVVMVTSRRRQLTSGGPISKNQSSSKKVMSKSSKVLLTICALYGVCGSFAFIVYYVSNIPHILNEIYIILLFEKINNLFQCINSVGNFMVYVAANNNFRYKDLRLFCCANKRSV